MFPWESPGGSPRRGRRWRDQTSPQTSLDKPDSAPSQGGLLDRPQQAVGHGGPLDNEEIRQRGMQDKRQASVNQDTARPATEHGPVGRPQAQDPFPSHTNVVPPPSTPAAVPHVPPPESVPSQPGPPLPQQYSSQPPYTTQSQPIPPQASIPQHMTAQQYTHQSFPQQTLPSVQYQPAPFTSPAVQAPPQTLPYQMQHQSPAAFQQSPQIPQPSSLERLEMTKLKAESELQQSKLMEYEVANEHHEQQRTRLEEEVKELMKKVQEMEGARQKNDLDATSKVSELEGKVTFLSFNFHLR